MSDARSRSLALALLLAGTVACGGAPPGDAPADSLTASDAARAPATGDSAADPPLALAADTVPAAGAADTTVVGRFFVRVVASADPEAVARRHGLEPERVHTEEARAFVAVLTAGQIRALRADSLVRSLAQQIEGESARPPEPRELPGDGGSGS